MTRSVHKLHLSRETLRSLESTELSHAEGAGRTQPTCQGPSCIDTCASCPPTCTCTVQCV